METTVRKPLGDVYPGERVTHAVMGIVYGAMIASLVPVLPSWGPLPSALVIAAVDIPDLLRWGLMARAIGVFASGLRDLYAAYECPRGSWPWR